MGMRRGKTKNPPIFSHEFLIQNHADIVSCVAMVFVVGLMFQATSPLASLFVVLQHNVTRNDTGLEDITSYTCGFKDICSTFFYLLICVVVHAVIQEYILDKLNRKMHLSKVKHSKFNESGQLLAFYLVSVIWGADIIIREGYFNVNQLWEGYPHAEMSFVLKFFFIIQMSYWFHGFPELYFQKVKKDEIQARVQYTSLYLAFIVSAYFLNFTRVAICILVLHYTVELVFHLARLLYFAEKTEFANTGFMVFNGLFVLVRLGSIILAVLTFWHGLVQFGQSQIIWSTGNFNVAPVRISCLIAVCLLQAWMMWTFINFHLRKKRERTPMSKKPKSPTKKKVQKDDISSLPEADQNTATENGMRARKGKKN